MQSPMGMLRLKKNVRSVQKNSHPRKIVAMAAAVIVPLISASFVAPFSVQNQFFANGRPLSERASRCVAERKEKRHSFFEVLIDQTALENCLGATFSTYRASLCDIGLQRDSEIKG